MLVQGAEQALEAALLLRRLVFVFLLYPLLGHVTRLGFGCLLRALFIGRLFLRSLVKNNTLAALVFLHRTPLRGTTPQTDGRSKEPLGFF
jgi:hypothetical protein